MQYNKVHPTLQQKYFYRIRLHAVASVLAILYTIPVGFVPSANGSCLYAAHSMHSCDVTILRNTE